MGPTVRVNAIAPTAIPSGMTSDLFSAGTEEDIVNTVLWLASSASGLITGHTLVMDGGPSLR